MNPQLLSFVVPITLKEKVLNLKWRDVSDSACGLRFQLLLQSFLKGFDLRELDRFLVVCPASDEEEVRAMLHKATTDPRFQVVSELAICPELAVAKERGRAIPGWYVQQILKLAAARTIESDFYLTLDSDIVCRKPFSVGSLFPDGKALCNVETPKIYQALYKEEAAGEEWRIKRNRLLSSAGLLGYRRKELYRFQSYGETPVLMHVSSVRDLLQFLSRRHGSWFRCLAANRGWTEYSLYFQFLEMQGGLEGLYLKADHNGVLDLEGSVWKNNDQYQGLRDNSPKSILTGRDESAGPFVAIQSYLATKQWLPSEYQDLGGFYADLNAHLLTALPATK